MNDYQKGVRAAVLLCALCLLASLSGCLTAAKIGQWQRVVYGWGMDASATKPCQVASAKASAYLANANRTLTGGPIGPHTVVHGIKLADRDDRALRLCIANGAGWRKRGAFLDRLTWRYRVSLRDQVKAG